MSYAQALERLKKLAGRPGGGLSKPTKGAFVSYGSTPGAHCEKNAPPKSEPPANQSTVPDLNPARLDNPLSAPVLVLVRCGQCRRFERDTVNPAEGIGRCGAGVVSERPHYPNAPRHCASWNPTPATLVDICRAACDGLAVKPEELARWLESQGDEGWKTPPAAGWWARHIDRHGYPKDRL